MLTILFSILLAGSAQAGGIIDGGARGSASGGPASFSTVTIPSGTGSKCFSADDPTLVVDCNLHKVILGGLVSVSTGYLQNGVAATDQGQAALSVVGLTSTTYLAVAGGPTPSSCALPIIYNAAARNTGFIFSSAAGTSIQGCSAGVAGFTVSGGQFAAGAANTNAATLNSAVDSLTSVSHSFNGDAGTGMAHRTNQGFFGLVSSATLFAVFQSTGGTNPSQVATTFLTVSSVTFQGSVTTSSATFEGIEISTQAAGTAGAAVTALCRTTGTFAKGGGYDCGTIVGATQIVSRPNCVAAGCIANGWTVQVVGGTGGQCSAYVICSRSQ